MWPVGNLILPSYIQYVGVLLYLGMSPIDRLHTCKFQWANKDSDCRRVVPIESSRGLSLCEIEIE